MSAAVTDADRTYAIGLARAFGGALIFAVPMFMTMEMWSLGATMDRGRLLLFMAVNFGLLIGLSYFAGFEETFSLVDDVMDALAAFAVGAVTSVVILILFAVVTPEMTWSEIAGKIALQTIPASIGAMLGRKQLAGDQNEEAEEWRKQQAGYVGELFLMLGGALFLAFNMAPTEEMALIAYQMAPWHALALGVLSIVLLHVFVYGVGFAGQEKPPEGRGMVSTFLHFTLAGYGLAIAMSLYVLWTFGRTDGASLAEIAQMVLVLAFPAALGAATARLVI
jgi:putative integral membrane protein (TIGR02587 family)